MSTKLRLTRAARAAAAALMLTAAAAHTERALAQSGEAKPEGGQTAAAETLKEYAGDTVLATVGDKTITLADLIAARRNLPPQAQGQPDAVLFDGLLDQLISRELFAQQGEAQKLGEDPNIQKQLAEIKRELVGREFLERTLAKAREGVSEEDAKKRYEEEIAKLPKTEEVRARHILVKTEDEAKAIKAELDGGADFAELAKEKSTGPSKVQGGDLGFFTKERMVPEFSTAAFALEKGQVSDPVKTAFGWHVIKVEEKRTQEPPKFEDVKERLVEAMARENVQAELTKLREASVKSADKRPPVSAIREDALAPADAQ